MSDKTMMLKKPQVEVTWPDGKIETVLLRGDTIGFGRAPEFNQIIVPPEYNSISRRHFEIRKEGFRYKVVDLESATVVTLNGDVVDEAYLNDGDILTVGNREVDQEVSIKFIYSSGEMLSAKLDDRKVEISELGDRTAPKEGAYLEMQTMTGGRAFYPLSSEESIIGREENADVWLPGQFAFVSGQHAVIRKVEEEDQILDLNSTNGTMVNGWTLSTQKPQVLRNGDVIRIGNERYGNSIGFRYWSGQEDDGVREGFSQIAAPPTMISKRESVIIGRDDLSDLKLDSPKVSRNHAMIEKIDGRYMIKDLGSTNGTYLNHELIKYTEIVDGDEIQIGDHILHFINGELLQYDGQGFRVDVVNLVKEVRTRKGKLRILDDIDMSVLPREFIAIVGGSGAGKTTLINALLGISRGTGEVLVNGHNFYEEYEKFRDQIGYVPQSDILHTALTTEKALDYAAQLRLPRDTTRTERMDRISIVLDTVNMNTEVIRQTRIRNLSGGQRKRISIAAELLADPKLLYLDEPTSGLDPGLEKKMMFTLRRMADQGRTVILITHATANIVQVDHVAFMSEGRLVFFGPPNEALDFFEVDEFADIYERIENHGSHWRDIFTQKKKEYYEKYISKRQETRRFLPIPKKIKKRGEGIKKFFRQLSVLIRRTFNIQSADLITFGLLAALYPFTAILQLLISTPDVLVGDLAIMADPIGAAKILADSYAPLIDTRLFIFITGLEAVLIGMYVPSNELILERAIYLRERMVNLNVLPYLTSKVVVFSIFAFIQCVLYLLVLGINVNYPEQGVYFSAAVEIFITVFITMVTSVGIGLFVSSMARSPDMAMYLLVILLFFQFFFAGVIFDLRGKSIEPLKYTTMTHWSMVALGSTIDLPHFAESTIVCSTLPDNPITPQQNDEFLDCRPYPKAVDDLQLKYGDGELLKSWGMMFGIGFFFFALTGYSIWREEHG